MAHGNHGGTELRIYGYTDFLGPQRSAPPLATIGTQEMAERAEIFYYMSHRLHG